MKADVVGTGEELAIIDAEQLEGAQVDPGGTPRSDRTMARIDHNDVAALLEHVGAKQPELLPACRWLALGRRLAPLILGQEWRAPALDDLAGLLRLVDGTVERVEATGWALVAGAELGGEALVRHGSGSRACGTSSSRR